MNAFLETEVTVFKIKMRMIDLLFFCAMLCLGLAARYPLFNYESGDYYYFLSHWMEECHNAGGFGYISIVPGVSDKSTIDYGCMYQYIIVLLHYLRGLAPDMYLIKWVSVIFDVVCAITVSRITYVVTKNDLTKAMMAFGIAMFLPTTVLNSAAWAQCESIYTSFVLLTFLYFLKGDNRRLFIYFALAYSFKQQTVFILPFMVIMWLKGRIRIRYALWVPVVLGLTMIPALIAGRSPAELLSIYFKQAAQYTRLTMNYPSIYAVVSPDMVTGLRRIIFAGTLSTMAFLGILCYYTFSRKFEITMEYMVTLAIFSIEAALFMLPVMHERYGYVAEILCIVYALTRYRRLAVASALWFIPVITYSRFLYGSTVTALWPLSVCILIAILFIGYDLYCQMKIPEGKISGK